MSGDLMTRTPHAACLPAESPPQLLVFVDTEEEFDWQKHFSSDARGVTAMKHQWRAQAVFGRYGVKPVYLVDYPVASQPAGYTPLREFFDDGRCEIGAHLHPWCNPPFEEQIVSRNTFLCNLPEPLQRAKLSWLTERIEDRVGRRPTAFRAGRYGLDIVGARVLEQLGYTVDSSVIPFTSYADEDGPDFSDAPQTPYFVGGGDLKCPQASGGLVELPVSIGYNRVHFERAHRMRQVASRPWLTRLHAVGILDRLGIARRIKFSPEQAGTRELIRLADNYLRRQAPALVLMFHSSSLMPGGSPYVPDAASVDRFLDRLAALFEYCLRVRGLATDTMSGFASKWLPLPATA